MHDTTWPDKQAHSYLFNQIELVAFFSLHDDDIAIMIRDGLQTVCYQTSLCRRDFLCKRQIDVEIVSAKYASDQECSRESDVPNRGIF